MQISIVYEDDNLLVINKPAGIITHPKNTTDIQPSVTDWVQAHYPNLKEIGESFVASGSPMPRYGIVHRLDKDTSGLLIITKNDKAFLFMKKQFQEHTLQKSYKALVYGRPKESPGIIDAPLGRIGMKRTTQLEGKKLIDGKESVTEYETIKTFDKYTLLDVHPKTGRTHQIRVHLKHIGCPIVGDLVYAPKGWQKPDQLNRLFLHAYKLTFTTPDGKILTLEADLPEDLQKVLSMLQ
ncbi:RluA family pseudouridine synthase [Candidatus Parcubacteria bacterium]|nr:RluA family pseudouridine synthase [Candidatus Parcubacteria bacterium]